MCVTSMIGDHYRDTWRPTVTPNIFPQIYPSFGTSSGPTQVEFDALKKEVQEMKELLKRAKAYDEQTGQKDCEMDEKMSILRQIAKLVGISLDEMFPERRSL